MEIFFTLLLKILPLYFIIGIGFIASKCLKIDKEPIAKLLIYVISPTIVLLGTLKAGLRAEFLMIPIIFYAIGALLLFVTLQVGKRVWKDGTEKIAAFAAGTGNTGYFGLPVCLASVGDAALPIVAMVSLGLILYENTLGFYVVSRASYTGRQALKKSLGLPSLYAFFIGISVNLLGITLPLQVYDLLDVLKGAYAPLGMMIIGLSLAGMTAKHLDIKFMVLTFLNKFVFWPLLMFGIIYLDKSYFHFMSDLIYQVIMIESLVPIAANTVAYASDLKAHPEKAAMAVLVSTFVALIYIPTMLFLFF